MVRPLTLPLSMANRLETTHSPTMSALYSPPVTNSFGKSQPKVPLLKPRRNMRKIIVSTTLLVLPLITTTKARSTDAFTLPKQCSFPKNPMLVPRPAKVCMFSTHASIPFSMQKANKVSPAEWLLLKNSPELQQTVTTLAAFAFPKMVAFS